MIPTPIHSEKIAVTSTWVLRVIARDSKIIQSQEFSIREDGTKPVLIHLQINDVLPLRLVKFELIVDVTRCLIRILPHLAQLKLHGVQLHEFHSSDILIIFKKFKPWKEESVL